MDRFVALLALALVLAGAASQVVSLWKVDDTATEILMTTYYGYLKQGLARSKALRQAQLDVSADHAHPYFWAAFIPVGDWRPMPTGSLGPGGG